MRASSTFLLGLGATILSLAACSSNPASPEDFTLPGTWTGTMNSTDPNFPGAFGDLELTLVGQNDGETEEYGGSGTLTGQQVVRRFSQVQAEYNTVDRTILMTILDLSLGGVFTGSYDGTNLFIADSSVACSCEAVLSRE